MICVLVVVVTITAAAFVTALPSFADGPSGPHGLDSISKIEIERQQNLMMNTYLTQFGAIQEKMEDQYSKENMDVIKLLIAHAWLYLMNPTKDELRGIILVDDTKTLEDIRNDIVLEIKSTPVADALLWYANGIQEKLRADAEKNIKTYNQMVVNRKIIHDLSDPRVKERLTRENKVINTKVEENRKFTEFNEVTFKMCLMSYVLICLTQSYTEDTFTITSSDGSQEKVFATPPLARNKFEQILFEAELELEVDRSPFPETGTESYTINDYRIEQSLVISKYLNRFELIRLQCVEYDDKNAYNIIKLLIVQSWIHMLNPDKSLMKNIVTVDPHKSTEDVRIDIIRELKETMKSGVEHAIMLYTNRLSPKVKNILQNQIMDLVVILDSNIAEIEMMDAGPLKERKIIEKNENLLKLEETRLNLQFHKITLKMCLQSFVFDFCLWPYPNLVVMDYTNGPNKEFIVPLLGSDSFEQLSYETLSIPEEED